LEGAYLDGIAEHWTEIEPDQLMSYAADPQKPPQMTALERER